MPIPRPIHFRALLGALVFLLALAPAWAQSSAARLQGIVTDPSGALVPDATVKVMNLGTNRTLQTATDAGTGAWSFPALPPGSYQLQITKTGFKQVQQNVTLEVAQVANVNVTLETGTVTEQVVVTGEAALVDSASSELGLTVQTKQIEDLPLNGRNFTQLATLIPGVNRGVPGNVATGAGNNAETFRYNSSGGAALVVNGARPQANNFMLDGLDNNESLVNTIVFFPPTEAIQEFKVQTSIPTAEFGRAGGAIVNTVTKSGTNALHGSAFEVLRNSEFDARPTFAPTVSPFRRNQFGGTLGGPIVKNKVFFFGDYQGFRQSTPVGVDRASVPTQLMRQGNFSELSTPVLDLTTGQPFSGNLIPDSRQNPIGRRYLNAYPAPNVTGVIQQNFVIQRQQVQTFNDFDIRADWMATANDTVFGRVSYAQDSEDTSTRLPGLPAGYGSGMQFTHARGAAAGYTHIFNPALLSDLRLGFQRTFLGYTPPYQSEPLSANLGIPNANTSPLLGGGALIGGWNGQLEYTGDYGPYLVPQNTYQIAESVSYIRGNHSFKFGANIIRRQVNLFRPLAGKGYFFLFGNGVGPGSTGYEVSDILAGFVSSYSIGPPFGMVGTRSWETGFFAQDDWRVNRKLTLNLGLRWDILTNPAEVNGRQANFNIASSVIERAAGGGDPQVDNRFHNFGPRIGFAYDLKGDSKTVVRGGYGVFYFLDRGGISNQLAQNPPFSGQAQYNFNDGYRITLSGLGPMGSGATGAMNWLQSTGALPLGNFDNLDLQHPRNVAVVAILPNNKTPYVQQWNLQVQRELIANTRLSLAYVGAAGRHLINYYNMNNQLFNTVNGTRLFPGLGNVNVGEARGNSIYNSLQTELSRRFSKGFQFTASYTFSRTIDDGGGAFGTLTGPQDFLNIALDRGLADQDVRNRFVFSGVYELPFGKGRAFASDMNRVAEAIVGGWQMNGIFTLQSGLPFTLSTPGSPGGRPDLVGELTTYPGNTQRYFNTSAVARTPLTGDGVMIRPGTLGRNTLIGPGVNTLDLSLFKDFALTERFKFEFRVEAFNLANHPVFNNPNGDIASSNFGVINGTQLSSERQLQFAARLFF